ncbi:hypothetical protein B0H63DRAFT_458463 [Podospora didyma]|uniref:Beta-lactamase-related domain-containing protein n=1 Tax=Podospora didyma TaxID=330526 RepID=A0AAE0P5B0_9PEZI|nr:hypothetical protein B0H63DRAFT_458463 [Podospora didyma]
MASCALLARQVLLEIGVFNGRTSRIYFEGYGHRDKAAGLKPGHKVYHLASLSKSLTAAAIVLLVADGKLTFWNRICEVLPGFHHADETIAKQSTILDFLTHRTGLASKTSCCLGRTIRWLW